MAVLLLKPSNSPVYSGYGDQIIVKSGMVLVPGEKYWVPSKAVFDELIKYVHTGIRSRDNNFYNLSQLDYIALRNGAYLLCRKPATKVVTKWLTASEYTAFKLLGDKSIKLSKGTAKSTGKPWYKADITKPDKSDTTVHRFIYESSYIKPEPVLKSYKIVRDVDEATGILSEWSSYEGYIGLDYETDGIPFENKKFKTMGVSIATKEGNAVYFDIQYMEEVSKDLDKFLVAYKSFLDKVHRRVITYNSFFEIRVTYLLLRVVYQFQDASALNKIEGNQYKRFSLKYTASRYLHVKSWDDDFEYLQDKLGTIYLGKKDKSDKHIVKPRTMEDYEESKEWSFIKENYPEEIDEFKLLMSRHWGKYFSSMPSNILGKYCCYDSFYTVLLREYASTKYDDRCWNTFDANLRIGAYLNMNGVVVDDKEKDAQKSLCLRYMTIGYLSIVQWLVNDELRSLRGVCELSEDVKSLLDSKLQYWDGKSFVNSLLSNPDTSKLNDTIMECISKSLRDNKIVPGKSKFNSRKSATYTKVSDQFMKLSGLAKPNSASIKNYNLSKVLKMLKYAQANVDPKSDSVPVSPVKSLTWSEMYNKLKKMYNISSPDVRNKFLYYSLTDNWNAILTCVRKDRRPKVGEKVMTYKYMIENDYIMDSEFGTDSHKDIRMSTKYPYMMHKLLRYVEAIAKGKVTDRADVVEYAKYVMENPLHIFRFFYDMLELLVTKTKTGKLKKVDISHVLDRVDEEDTEEEEDDDDDDDEEDEDENSDDDKSEDSTDLESESDTSTTDSSVAKVARQWIPNIRYDAPVLAKDPIRLNTVLGTVVKFVTHKIKISIASKGGGLYTAVNSQSALTISGSKLAKYMESNWNTIDCTGYGVGSYLKLYSCYKIVRRFDKAYQYLKGMLEETEVSTVDYDENGVAISSKNGTGDLKRVFPAFNICEKKSKRWSADFHTIPPISIKRVVSAPKDHLLTYFDISGAEVRSIAYLSKCKFFLDNYAKGLDPYVESARVLKPGQDEEFYWKHRGGYKSLILGKMYGIGLATLAKGFGVTVDEMKVIDKEFMALIPEIRDYIKKSVKFTEESGMINTILGDKLSIKDEPHDRWSRLAINLKIQGFSALALAAGFENIISRSYLEGAPQVRPLNVVHDSSQNYIKCQDIWVINQFYTEGLTDWCYDTYGVRFEFKTLVGTNYYDLAVIKPTEDGVKLSGSATSINNVLNQMDSAGVKYKAVCDDKEISRLPVEIVPEFQAILKSRLYSYNEDTSSYEVKLTKI